jgi:hypothetical protein
MCGRTELKNDLCPLLTNVTVVKIETNACCSNFASRYELEEPRLSHELSIQENCH